jgi:hypothetical protein
VAKKQKTDYKNVQIPKVLVDNVIILMPFLGYRTHHEFIIEALRIRIGEAIEIISKIDDLQSYKITKQQKIKDLVEE